MNIVYLVRTPGIARKTPEGCRSTVIASRPDGSYAEDDLRQLEEADVLVVGLEPVDESLLERAPRLRLIQRLGRGYCNIDLDAAARRGIPVCGMPDFNAASVAEHTIMLMLALLRRVFESTLLMKAGRWPLETVVAGGIFDLQGRTLGIVGLGAIGRAVADRAVPFGMHIRYHDDRARPPSPGIEPRTLERLLQESDVVSLHAPLTPANRHMIGRRELAQMKRSALLINTARGALVEEDALADALERREIAGAGVDVFSREPLEGPHRLARCPNVLLTPHVAGQTREAMDRMVAAMLENLDRAHRGEDPLHALDFTR
jgi:phosphoglycerate dehydrogenase-like enzyme